MNNEEKKINIELFSRQEYIPILSTEAIDNQKGWVKWGLDNLYPEYIKSLLMKSSLHSSITKQKAMGVGGRGWDITGLSNETLIFLKNIYNEDDLDEILFKISYDLEVYGGFFLNLIWSKDKTYVSEINYVDPSKVRIQVPKNERVNENYWVADSWLESDIRKYPPTLYPGFSTSNKKSRSQILYVKDYYPGHEWYAIPEYTPGIDSIETGYLIKRFHLNSVFNGFAPDMHINFPIGQPSQEEAFKLIRRLKEQFQGAENASNQVITFSDSKDTAVTFEKIELNTSDSRFLLLEDAVKKEILQAHRVTNPKIFGEDIGSGGLGNNKNEMIEGMELFSVFYTEPKQRFIEKIFNKIARINGLPDELLISKYQPQFSKVGTSIGDVLSILTADITPDQKYNLLLANDYSIEAAKDITGYDPQKINISNE